MNISDLFLEGNVPDDVFSLLMLKSTHLQTILLSIHSDDFRWDYQGLVIPSKLKSLQFWNSNVTDIFLTSIINANLETMEELDISLCLTPHSCASQLTPKGYIAISELVHLKRLTLFEEEPKQELNVRFIKELKNLEYLSFQTIRIVEDSHLGIWKCLPKLKELYLRGVDGINNVGDISQLQNLRFFELAGIEDIFKSFAVHITSLKNLRTLDFNISLYSHYRYTDFDILSGFKDMSSLRKIILNCYTEDKILFYKIIAKLCEVDQPSRGEEIQPKWSVAIQNNECILCSV